MGIKRDAADIVFSKVVRTRDGECLVCGKRDTLECAHIYGRRAIVTRWDMMNAVTLCHYHHRHFTENPVEFHQWLTGRAWRGTHDYLAGKAQRHPERHQGNQKSGSQALPRRVAKAGSRPRPPRYKLYIDIEQNNINKIVDGSIGIN